MTLWSEGPSSSSLTQEYTEEEKDLEQKLLPYDILGNLAHVKMLEDQGYLNKDELEQVENALKEIYQEKPEVNAEDVHTFVEEKVTEKTEAGKKIHTGRSRNDQVVLDTRLFMKDAGIEIADKTLELVETLEEFAENENELIPGYTHQQQAMPSSTGLWASSFAGSLIDDLRLLKGTFQVFDSSPLGAAAGYGTSLDIDRKKTAESLGFEKVQQNPIYCSGGRGKHELMLLQNLDQVMLDIQKMAEDLINSSEDQKIFEIADSFCTGSSIMPQKKNPDVLEIMRASAEEMNSHQQAVRNIIAKLPSGYNRDTQKTKKHLIAAAESTIETIEVMEEVISSLEVASGYELKDEVFAAYTANQKVEKGLPFREAYHQVKKAENYQKSKEVKKPKMQGYSDLRKFWSEQDKKFQGVKDNLLDQSL